MNCKIQSSNPTTTITSPFLPNRLTITTTRISIQTRPIKLPVLALTMRASLNDTLTKNTTTNKSFYELLSIPKTGSLPEIKQAYKQLARVYHPDVSPPGRVKEYTELFIRVREAYETLSDPSKRAIYDIVLSTTSRLHVTTYSPTKNVYAYDEEVRDKREWQSQWQSQVSELKRSSHKDARRNMSCGARMRQRD